MLELTLKDMSCGHCAGVVTKTIKVLDANATIDIDLATKKVKIDTRADSAAIARALTEAGYAPG